MGILENLEKYFDKLTEYAVNHHPVMDSSPVPVSSKKILYEPKFTLPENKFTVILNGEKIEVLINNGTIYVNTTLNIVINSNLVSLSGNNGVHLNPPSPDVNEMKRTYEISKMMEPEVGECTNCEEPVKRITNE